MRNTLFNKGEIIGLTFPQRRRGVSAPRATIHCHVLKVNLPGFLAGFRTQMHVERLAFDMCILEPRRKIVRPLVFADWSRRLWWFVVIELGEDGRELFETQWEVFDRGLLGESHICLGRWNASKFTNFVHELEFLDRILTITYEQQSLLE